MLYSVLVFIVALLALVLSLYKDRKIERRDPAVVRALRLHHAAQALLLLLALGSTLESARSAEAQRVALVSRDYREKSLGLRADLQRYTNIVYTLSKAKNYRNATPPDWPFGMDLPNNAVDRARASILALANDLERTFGAEAPETKIAREVQRLLDGGIGLTSFGSPAFVSEINSAETAAERAAVYARHPCQAPEAQEKSSGPGFIVAPSGRSYFLPQTHQILDGLDSLADQLWQRSKPT